MKTVTIQIGNSDDKLTQKEWAELVFDARVQIHQLAGQVHFEGAPPNWKAWQNVAWVIVIEEPNLSVLKEELLCLKLRCRQESIAWTEGETQFV